MIYVKVKHRSEHGMSNRVVKLGNLLGVIAEIKEAAEANKTKDMWYIGFVELEKDDFEKRE